ncbi:uncharacterized protein UTRI_10423 [Ustilago trichophora]|uniref:Uncharacterized protein n=1 Tax=Ustilago trichophora TaxID=86804 RepID=A0A5C3ECJ1_9BASI|nr:uncharacterized protein UTRI_10423 [Ustilago trichophora]
MLALLPQTFLLLCVTLMLTVSPLVSGTELTEQDKFAHQQLQEYLIGTLDHPYLRGPQFDSLNLQYYMDKHPNLVARLKEHAQTARSIIHIPSPSPSRSAFSFRRRLRVHVIPTYYMSVIKSEGDFGPLFGLRHLRNNLAGVVC